MKKCEICGKRRKRVLRVRVLGIEDADVCRGCALDMNRNITPERWRAAERKAGIANAPHEPRRDSGVVLDGSVGNLEVKP